MTEQNGVGHLVSPSHELLILLDRKSNGRYAFLFITMKAERISRRAMRLAKIPLSDNP